LPGVHRRWSSFGQYKIGCGGCSDTDRDGGARRPCGGVPGYERSVRESRAGGKTRSNLRPEAHVDGLPGRQRTVGCGVVRGEYRTHDRDPGGYTVHGRRWRVHKRETTCTRAVEIVGDYDRGGGVRRGIGHVHQVIKLPARQRSAAAHHADLLGNCQPWVHYHDDLCEVPPLKAEKRITIWCNATVSEIDDPSVRVNYCEVDSRGTISVRVR